MTVGKSKVVVVSRAQTELHNLGFRGVIAKFFAVF